ncbi:MAG: hypothetical protein V2A78_08020 [bacterium]
MATDIIDIALLTITDFLGFERLAAEVLQLEGFAKIKPLGLRDDKGIDAAVERFFQNDEVQRTVFQFTTQEYLTAKVRDTIETLRRNTIPFDELIIATNRPVSAKRQASIKQEARKKFNVRVDIYEYQTFHARLSDLSNAIFSRHFPDIDKQLTFIRQQSLLLAQPASSAHEIAMMRVSCALSFHDLSNQARRNVFDNLTLTILGLHSNPPVRPEVLVTDYNRCVPGLAAQPDQVRASLERLHARGLVTRGTAGYSSSEKTTRENEAAILALNRATESLLQDVLDSVETLAKGKLSVDDKRQIYMNTRTALSELLRLSGLDLARQVDEAQTFVVADARNRQDLVALAKTKLPELVGESLVAVLGDLLANPEPDQAEVLASWCRTFVGAQLMQMDPMLNEFQASKFASKTFVLDTDTVLDAVVTDAPGSAPILGLVQKLLSLRCKVVVPLAVVQECVEHAQHSESTFNYFGNAGAGLATQYLEERVNNAFVKGYFYALQNRAIPRTQSYEQYLGNYYEPSHAIEFFTQVLKTTFPDGVSVDESSVLLGEPLNADMLTWVEEQLYEELKRSRKADYRTDEETKALAHTDAEIYVLVQQMNSAGRNPDRRVMGGNVYLVTSSRSYIRAAKTLGMSDHETVLPKTLIVLIERIAGPILSSMDVLRLFENPFMAHAVNATWEDVHTLVQAGINTEGKHMSRLRWDLDQALHAHLTTLGVSADEPISVLAADDVRSFGQLIEAAKQQGYTLVPEVEHFVSEYEKLAASKSLDQDELRALKKRHEKLMEKIDDFGKRKRKYLRRLSNQ